MTAALAYGTWPSRLPASALAAGAVRLMNLVADGDRLLWNEGRPTEGRQALVSWRRGDDAPRDLGPEDFSARTMVHEYGGASVVARDAAVLATDFATQRIHRIEEAGATPITAEPPVERGWRHADGQLTTDGSHVICVREDHTTGDDEPRNELVAIAVESGDVRVLVDDRDFVGAPRLSGDGRHLAWLAWDHPHMPWEAAELWLADVGEAGDGSIELRRPRRIAGGPSDAASSPAWSPDGDLYASLDGSGFLEVHRVAAADLDAEQPSVTQVTQLAADVGYPAWLLGFRAIAPLGDGRLVVIATSRATDRLVLVEADGATRTIEQRWVDMQWVVPFADGVAVIGSRADGDGEVATWSEADGVEVLRTVEVPLAAADRSLAVHLEVPVGDGQHTNAFLYRPTSADAVGPDGTAPPLVMMVHGGPTGHGAPAFSPAVGYWTTRGFAVAFLNYRGSTGHGRQYRQLLRRAWGVLDVEDAIAVAQHLVDLGEADGDRLAIRGGSAGGYTTLAVLTAPEHPFGAGTSYFGVGDLVALAEDCHKFESHYFDFTTGRLPEDRAIFVERSPLTHVDRLSRPILVLQGLQDAVVPPAHAEQIVAAAKARGVPHAYLPFEGEQHGFRRAENIITWHESELAFYGQVFGFTPAGDLPELELVTGSSPPAAP